MNLREVAVVGIGGTKFGKHTERSIRDLAVEASLKALKDGNVNPKDIQVACGGNLAQWEWGQGLFIAQVALREIGITKIPMLRVENGCATGSTAFRDVWFRIAAGEFDIGLALGVEQMTVVDSSKILSVFSGRQYAERGGEMGFTAPGLFSMIATRHMKEFGTTREQIARVAVKNRKFGALNRDAQLPSPVSLEEVLNARMIADPLTLPQCCPRGDGAAAVVLMSKEAARKYTTKPVYVAANVMVSGSYPDDESFTGFNTDVRGSQLAYEKAGLGPEDIDVAEVHDCFSIAELIHYEDLGFCRKGEAGRFIDEGHSDMGGKVVVGSSGGLLSKGHVIGATGLSQITEVTRQLRGEAGKRQVEGAKVGLQHNGGGFIHTDAASCCINILKN